MPHWEFPATEPIDLTVQLAAGGVSICAETIELVTVDVEPTRNGRRAEEYAEEVQVEFEDGHLSVSEPQRQDLIRHGSGLDVRVTVPTGSRASVNTASAAITCDGELGSLNARSASGDIRAAAITGDTNVNATSGKIEIGETDGTVNVKSASGAIDLGRAGGELNANTVSGKIQVGSAETSTTIHSASGAVRIERLARGEAEVATVSGDVRVKIAPRTGVYLDLASISGKVTSELEPADGSDGVDLRLYCRTISGGLRVSRADAAAFAG
ncbi:MAG TPA: DUF4097 family beta strand repeat-containing protein [Streptosporangiaceae bacterium]|nr:DUF4097 family beta strand repeat-containing protein [Streptosporangiaceae bacterium]